MSGVVAACAALTKCGARAADNWYGYPRGRPFVPGMVRCALQGRMRTEIASLSLGRPLLSVDRWL